MGVGGVGRSQNLVLVLRLIWEYCAGQALLGLAGRVEWLGRDRANATGPHC